MATILIVDDRGLNREFLVTLLGHDGHRLLEAADGASALALLRAERPQLVITDILMPTLDGYEFAQLIRGDPEPALAQTPIIFYTAKYNLREALALARAAGVHYVITKPAEPQVILDTVNTALGVVAPALVQMESEPLPDPLQVVSGKLTEKMGELSSRERRLGAVVELMLHVAAEREPKRLLALVCDAAREIIGAKYAAIDMLADADNSRHMVTSGLDAETMARIGPLPGGLGVLGKLLAEGKPLRLADLAAEPSAVGLPPGHPPMRSFLGVPIASPAGHYGRLYLSEKIGALEFSDDDERLAVALAAQVAVAYENARRYDEIQSYAARLQLEMAKRQKTQAALDASGRKFQALIEHSADAIAVNAPDRTLLYASPTVERLTGVHAELGEKVTFYAHVHPEDLERTRPALDQVMQTPWAATTVQFRIQHPNGDWHWLEVSVTNLTAEPSVGGVVSNFSDITDRKGMEAALEAREQRFRALIDNAPDGISVLGSDGKTIYASPAVERLLGYAPAELLGSTPAEYVHPDDLGALLALLNDLMQKPGQRARTEYRFRHKDGSWRWLESAISNLLDEPSVGGLVFNYRDISERRQAAETIQQLAAIVESSNEAIIGCSLDGRITSWNSAAQAILGYPAEAVIGHPLATLATPEQMRGLAAGLERLQAGERIEPVEQVWTHQDRHPVEVAASLSLVRAADGQIIGSAIIARDISNSKRAEEAVHRLTDEEIRQRTTRVITELAVIVALGLVAAGLSIYFKLSDRLDAWSSAFGGHFVDDAFAAAAVILAGLLVFAYRRWQESTSEVSSGKQAEQALQTLHEELETRIQARTADLVRTNAALRAEVKERGQVEEALAASAAELRALFAAMNDVVLVLDAEGRYLQIAPTDPALLVKPAAELLGRTLHEVLPRADADRMLEQIQLALHKPGTVHFEYNLTIDGAALWFETTISPIGADRVIWVSRDVSEQRQRQLEMGAIATVSTALRTASGRAQMSPIILDQLLGLFGAYGAALDLYNAASGIVTIDSARGAWEALTGREMDASEGIIGHVVTSGERYVNNDAEKESRLFAGVTGESVRAVACVPIFAQGRVLGGLWVGRQTPFGEADLRVLTAIADMAGNAIQRASLLEQTQRRLEHLAALRSIDTAINSGLDVMIILNVVLDQAISQLRVDAADFLLLNANSHQLDYGAGRGFRAAPSRRKSQQMGQGFAGQAALERRAISRPNLELAEPDPTQASLWSDEGFKGYYSLPLIAKGAVAGVLEIFQRSPLQLDVEWREFMEALAGEAAIAVESGRLFHDLERSNVDLTLAYEATIEGWSRALDLRDKETEGHTQRVTELTLRLAGKFGIRDQQLNQMQRGALLHDIGKMGVPDNILLKPGPLSDAEWVIMRQHPGLAYQMLAPITYLRESLDIPYCHHEKWDGSGYPRGLKGEQIPLAARLFAVVDVWDALRSDRPYRPGWPKAEVRAHIRAQTGQHFDPAVVAAFEQMMDEEA
jgi:PAS domain S-box-containing protein